MSESVRVVVIGAGSAGLAVSRALGERDIEHLVLERSHVAATWRSRWDSFCLVTPNWTLSLPGAPYDGDDPEGFVPRDDIVRYLEGYAHDSKVPVREGVEVDSLEAGTKDRFVLHTSDGAIHANTVVVCTGAYQQPHRPPLANEIPSRIHVLDATEYRRPSELPPGKVLVVGSGQTGCQLAEELHIDGRDVFLACGRAPWMPRRIDGRDLVTWMSETAFFDAPSTSLPSPQARFGANIQATGRDGGHDLHYRTLQAAGVELLGHLAGVDEDRFSFADDLAESVAFGDAKYAEARRLLNDQLPARGIEPPALPDPPPFVADPPLELAAADIGAVIFSSGFRPGYSAWVRFPAFDEMGFPVTDDGASTEVPGLYFCGVHFLRKRKSSLLFGVGEDAAVVAQSIAERS